MTAHGRMAVIHPENCDRRLRVVLSRSDGLLSGRGIASTSVYATCSP